MKTFFKNAYTAIKGFASTYRMYLFIAAFVAIAGPLVYHLIKNQGAAEEKAEQATAQVVATKKGMTDSAKITQDVMQLPAADLDRRLDKWMRD